MFKHEKVLWITRTALLIAITVILQALTVPLGNQILTGSIVNLMLILSVMTCGLPAGITVGMITPMMPTLLGFGPVWPIVPFIAAGNISLVTLWHIIGNRKIPIENAAYVIALIAAAGAKYLVLFYGITYLAIPVLLKLPEPQASVVSALFSYPQLITASLGGMCAIILLPTLKKAIKN